MYDPLYYAFTTEESPQYQNRDVIAAADSDFIDVSAAYSESQGSGLLGNVMPKYYGSWTLDNTTQNDGQEVAHEVRMIIIEHVIGVPMSKLDPCSQAQKERENNIRKVIEAEYDIRSANVQHEDLEPRNIMISIALPLSDHDLRVTIIDY
jgi:hypothetical protein